MNDHHELQRFVTAQAADDAYSCAVRELRRGRKQNHWMWFVFPQIAGLGHSATAKFFAVSGLPEAVVYLAHPVLGSRLRECAGVLTDLAERDPAKVFGPVDAQKLQSSMTLFSAADPLEHAFQEVLDQYFDGAVDEGTTQRL